MKQKSIYLEVLAKPPAWPGTRAFCAHFSRICGQDVRAPRGFARTSLVVIQVLLVSVMWAVSANAQDSEISISKNIQNLQFQAEVIEALQKNVDILKNRIIDLISKEEITIDEEIDERGRPSKTTNLVSWYRVIPDVTKTKYTSDCKFVFDVLESTQPIDFLREERNILSTKIIHDITRNKVGNFDEQFWARGSSYAGLFVLFDKQYEKCFDYKLLGIGKLKELDVYVIEIKQKEIDIGNRDADGASAGTYSGNVGVSWNLKYDGILLVDAKTMEIVQLNRRPVGINYGSGANIKEFVFTVQYEYEKVKIRDQFLTLPVAKNVKLFEYRVQGYEKLTDIFRKQTKNWHPAAEYKYRYGEYRAFGVDTKINFSPIDESSIEEMLEAN